MAKKQEAFAIHTRNPEPQDFRSFVTTAESVEFMANNGVCEYDADNQCYYRTAEWPAVMHAYGLWEKESGFHEKMTQAAQSVKKAEEKPPEPKVKSPESKEKITLTGKIKNS